MSRGNMIQANEDNFNELLKDEKRMKKLAEKIENRLLYAWKKTKKKEQVQLTF